MLALLVFAAILTSELADAARAPEYPKSEIFVFANGYVLDLSKGLEKWLPTKESTVDRCDQNGRICVKTTDTLFGASNFVLPKECRVLTRGESWSAAGITTKVLATNIAISFGFSGPVAALKSSVNDKVIFYYSPNAGIIGVQFGLAALHPEEITNGSYQKVDRLLTFDRLFPCDRSLK